MPNPDPAPALTPDIIAGHERLHPRVVALLKQVEKPAGRQPQQAVPAALLAVARQLFREARKILGREAGRIGAAAGADLGALAVGLGQLRAALEAFEAANTVRSRELGCIAWRLDPPVPVARLRPPLRPAPAPSLRASTDVSEVTEDDMRSTFLQRIVQRENAVYMKGYRDARDGKPPRQPLTEIEII